MADLLIWANKQATAARAAGQASLSDDQLAEIRSWYRGAVAKGITDNQHRRSQIAKDGLRLARRFRDHQNMILRFATDLAVGFTSNQADYAEFGVMRTRRWMPWHAGGPGLARPA
jgi:transposase